MLLITSTANIKTWERDNGLYGGLSPLARGTWALPEWGLFCTRFIPAAAGNSSALMARSLQKPVYPRWRGELFIKCCDTVLANVLSPLARGTRQNGLSSLVRLRFIPAGAGNTCFRKSMDYCYSVYPRWRGEHGRTEYKAVYLLGLSPLARGTLALQQQHPWPRRFIPAGAGNTLIITYY